MSAVDPCTEHAELVAIRKALVSGKAVKTARFGEDEVERFRADLSRLDQLIAQAARDCAAASGKRHTPHRRALTF